MSCILLLMISCSCTPSPELTGLVDDLKDFYYLFLTPCVEEFSKFQEHGSLIDEEWDGLRMRVFPYTKYVIDTPEMENLKVMFFLCHHTLLLLEHTL